MPNAPFTKSGDTIVQDFAASAQATSKKPLNFGIGSVFRALAEAVAGIADWLQKLYLFTLLVSRLKTSRGLWVDTFCADFMPSIDGSVTADLPDGSPRLPASPASGIVTFSRSTPQAQTIIPIGTHVTTFDGSQVFQVTADVSNTAYSETVIPGGGYIIPAGTTSLQVPVTALSAGASGNIAAGSITLIRSPLVGVDSVTNAADISDGLDAESDDALNARFKLFIQSLRAGTVDAIGYAIVSIQQGVEYAIHENILPNGSTDSGSLTIYVDDGTGAISATLVQEAADAVDGIRAGGTRPNVIAATKINASVTMVIDAAAGYYKPTVVAAVANALGAYIQSLKLEQTLRYTMLEHIAYNASPGVANVSSVLLNGAQADIVPAIGQIIRVGGSGVVVS